MTDFLTTFQRQLSPRRLGGWLILFGSLALTACHSTQGDARMVGSERDAHGCIPSAGYVWDTEQQKCVRPWENK